MEARATIDAAVARLDPTSRVVDVQRLTGGVSAFVCAIDLETGDGARRRVVFRQHRGAPFKEHGGGVAAMEHDLLSTLHGAGFAVPEPFLLDVADDGPYLVTEWIEGRTDVDGHDLDDALDQMADLLVRLHGLDPAAVDVPGLVEIEDPLDELADLLPSGAVGARLREALVAGRVRRVANHPVLVHGDYWPGNVMWRDGRLVAVLDWEDACLGDPLADLACSRVELRCRYGSDAMARFTDAYLAGAAADGLSVSVESLPIWEAYVSAAALASMSAWGLAPDDEARRRHRTERFFEAAVDALLAPT